MGIIRFKVLLWFHYCSSRAVHYGLWGFDKGFPSTRKIIIVLLLLLTSITDKQKMVQFLEYGS